MSLSNELIAIALGMVFILSLAWIAAGVLKHGDQAPPKDPHDARRIAFVASTFAGISAIMVFAIAIDVVRSEGTESYVTTLIPWFAPIATTLIGFVIGAEVNKK